MFASVSIQTSNRKVPILKRKKNMLLRLLSVSAVLLALVASNVCQGQLFQFEDFDATKYLMSYEMQLEKELLAANDAEKYRLTDDTYPILYDVSLIPNSTDTSQYYGEVFAQFKANRATGSVVVNLEGIVISEARVFDLQDFSQTNLIDGCDATTHAEYLKAECRLLGGAMLDPTKTYVLHMVFQATLWGDNRGLYPSYYSDLLNQRKELLTTHFGQQARRLFPCWDEPRFKAQFKFYIFRDPMIHTTSISNANIEQTVEEGLWKVDVYKRTTDISTYILAVVISDFTARTDGYPRGQHKFAVFARSNAFEQTRFAQEIGPQLIEAFNEWTGLNYYEFKDVEKMDMAAVPDFSAGAMENWGLMIHREVNILYDQRFATSLQRQRIALVISHEVSHMWFGDLVTCDWWDATWLNEGFARYFQFVAMAKVGL